MIGQFYLTMIMPSSACMRVVFILVLLTGLLVAPNSGAASNATFPLPPGVESYVEFWKKIFTGTALRTWSFFDPVDPAKIYGSRGARRR